MSRPVDPFPGPANKTKKSFKYCVTFPRGTGN